MKVIQFKKGAAVVIQNQQNPGIFYIIKSGSLHVSSEHRLNNKILAEYGTGESFGLVSAFTGNRFLSSVFAREDSELIEIPLSQLPQLLSEDRELAVKMFSLYTRELREIHRYLSRVNPPAYRPNSPERLLYYADMYIKLEQYKYASCALNKYLSLLGEEDTPVSNPLLEDVKKRLKASGENYHCYSFQSDRETLPEGEIVFMEGEPGEDIYIIKSGAVKIFYLGQEHEIVIDVLGDGEIFGEMAMIDHKPRMASAITRKETEIIRATKDTLFDSLDDQILVKIFESLTRRIWFSYQKLFALKVDDPIARIYNFIHQLMQKRDLIQKNRPSVDISFDFDINLEELKKMCGLSKIEDERLKPFLKDPNITISDNMITVTNWKKIEEKMIFYKSRVG